MLRLANLCLPLTLDLQDMRASVPPRSPAKISRARKKPRPATVRQQHGAPQQDDQPLLRATPPPPPAGAFEQQAAPLSGFGLHSLSPSSLVRPSSQQMAMMGQERGALMAGQLISRFLV